jgi:4-amino-4-deoxy-L-arabinose transferase-like glycosyltransferase
MKKTAPIIILTIISALFIFYRFVDIPKYLVYDEVEFTKLALSLDKKPYIPYSQLATGHSTLYFYILLASLKTFGINTFALRLPVAIFGVLSVIVFYLILEIIYQKSKILNTYYLILTTFILLSSRWFLNFARFSFEATFLLFLELVSIYFLIKSELVQKAKTPVLSNRLGPLWGEAAKNTVSSFFYLTISGLFAGLAFLSYTPGRIFFLLPLGFLILKRYRQGKYRRGTASSLLCFLIPFVITITPLTSYILTHKESRIDKLFFWRNHEMTLNEKVAGTANNVKTITLMFFTKGDMNGKHNYPGKPALNPILGILFIVGLLISIKNYKDLYNKIFLFYFLISLFPSLAIYPWENPNMLRTFTVLPSIIFFVGMAIYKSKKIPIFIFVIIIAFSSFYELRTYFKYQSEVFKESFEIKWPLDKAIKLKDPYEKVP